MVKNRQDKVHTSQNQYTALKPLPGLFWVCFYEISVSIAVGAVVQYVEINLSLPENWIGTPQWSNAALLPHSSTHTHACGRLFGMIGVIRTNSSEPFSLRLHPRVCWPDFVNPLVLLLLYFTLVALLHKWDKLTDQVCVHMYWSKQWCSHRLLQAAESVPESLQGDSCESSQTQCHIFWLQTDRFSVRIFCSSGSSCCCTESSRESRCSSQLLQSHLHLRR